MAEQADAHDSKSCTFGYVGSIPTFGKKKPLIFLRGFLIPSLVCRVWGEVLAADKVCVVLAAPDFAFRCLARMPAEMGKDFSARQMGIGSPKRFVEVARGGFEIASLLGIKNVDTSVEFDNVHDRFLSVKVQTNAVPARGEKHQENNIVGIGQWIRS